MKCVPNRNDRSSNGLPSQAGFCSLSGIVFWMFLAGAFLAAPVTALEGPQYVGSKKCKKCHLKIHKAFFANNKMAKALDSLKPEEYTKKDDFTESGKLCIECHVTGYGKPGGFTMPADPAQVKDLLATVGHVGCESCHGPGSEHAGLGAKELKKRFAEGGELKIQRRASNACVECHNPHVSHKRGAEIKGGTWTKDRSFSSPSVKEAEYAGADTCKPCHAKQYDTWSKTLHAQAFSVLKPEEYEKMDDALDPKLKLKKPPEAKKCIACHVTGYGKGGFKNMDDPGSKKFLNVQCEVCHGPGSLHNALAEEYKAAGKDLKSLRDKKINRVPQNACRECHNPHILHRLKYPGRR